VKGKQLFIFCDYFNLLDRWAANSSTLICPLPSVSTSPNCVSPSLNSSGVRNPFLSLSFLASALRLNANMLASTAPPEEDGADGVALELLLSLLGVLLAVELAPSDGSDFELDELVEELEPLR